MIKVNRLDIPDILKHGLNPVSNGEAETKDAIIFFGDPINHQSKYQKTGKRGGRTEGSYSVYSDINVRKVLLRMFHGKCAYCESKITAIYNGDIEHFRPKGKIEEANSKKPGYYWLAADWENLLFACPFCNQTNTHEILDGGIIKKTVLGKLNQFPLASERYRLKHTHGNIYLIDRATYNQAFDREESERLLLNPCKDDEIEKFFKYGDDGAIIVSDGLNPIEHKKSESSIRVYALHRLNLSQARQEKIIQIKAQIRRVEQAIKNYNNYSDTEEKRTWFEGVMREEMRILKRFKSSDQEYAGLARYIIDKYFNDADFI
ncbi:hypothetical protein EZS27_009571 [termite gut metagenome]|uniref:HNH nuclease domain-containing protein n=1 Tax=termite gut metagenome TaxID=433724 RepID=A0A5J4S983_9ZZZZ